ncbi:hypothetical protein [Umezawaea beigongshangensis]|uniref:hypothetical protein n=1 Tax=Umezawaea beigongshangensis TaxID=2780383 RepID=UPI0018F1DAD4|nr:hypothetical protein [Umezawaea beigongshangensis]
MLPIPGFGFSAPQPSACGRHDSPVAAPAWTTQIVHEFNATGRPLEQVIDRDLFPTDPSVHWFTGTFGSSAWPHHDSTGSGWSEGHKAVRACALLRRTPLRERLPLPVPRPAGRGDEG